MHIVAQLRPIDLHNFQAKYQWVVSFWVPVNYPSLNELVSMPELLSFPYPPIYACVSYLSAMILLFLDLQGALFHSPLELKITVSSIQSQTHLGICLPTAGSQTWVCSVWEFFLHKWWIKYIRNQHIKCNERRTRPCNRAYYIGGPTPFHSCMIVRSPKLVSNEHRTGPGPHLLPTALPWEYPLHTLRHQCCYWVPDVKSVTNYLYWGNDNFLNLPLILPACKK